jgi:ribosomal protein L11 methylase PrmA
MIQLHIHMHAKMIKKYENTRGRAEKVEVRNKRFNLSSHKTMAEGLFDATAGIKNPSQSTEWGDYYNDTNYDDAGFHEKKKIIENICTRVAPRIACDFGANLGEFSRVLAKHAKIVLAPDIDPVAVERNYLLVKKNKEENIYPIVQDLCNPSPGIGWMNKERESFIDRAKCDLAAGLALIHHLCIGNNLPLDFVADMFATVSENIILEFVPKEDSQVQRLLSSREDIFPDYDLERCISAFARHYRNCERFPIPGSTRTVLFFSNQ